jgi:hypothetical protein
MHAGVFSSLFVVHHARGSSPGHTPGCRTRSPHTTSLIVAGNNIFWFHGLYIPIVYCQQPKCPRRFSPSIPDPTFPRRITSLAAFSTEGTSNCEQHLSLKHFHFATTLSLRWTTEQATIVERFSKHAGELTKTHAACRHHAVSARTSATKRQRHLPASWSSRGISTRL